jgi:ribonuclease HII
MGFLIGTDEAGYGPNLGPLVVSSTIWQVPDDRLDGDLYDSLAPLVVSHPSDDSLTIPIADSKQLYRPGGSLADLERGVLTALAITKGVPRQWDDLWQSLCPDVTDERLRLPWYDGFDCGVPVDIDHETPTRLAALLQTQLDQVGVRLHAVRSTVLFPAPFNRLVEQFDSKGTVLSTATLDLLADMIERLPSEPMRVVCDKHGGRNHYSALLQPRLCPGLVRVIKEGREESAYDIGEPGRPREIYFRARGEAFLPSALASMTSKYLREIAMRAFNRFWCEQVEDLKPTAGYPMDARRFKQQISATQAELGIRDSQLWRQR